MATTSTTWHIPKAAWLAIGCAAAAEATSNALRAYGLGSHLEAFTFTLDGVAISVAGTVLVLAAIAVTLTQTRATWVAFTPGSTRQRIVCGLAALLLLSISVTAMVSHILEAQRAKVADEGGERGAYDRAISEYATLLGQLHSLQKYGDDGQQLPRDGRVVQAAIDKAPIDMAVWRRSKQCTDMTKQESKDACRPVLALYEERGANAALVQLQPKITAIEEKLAGMKRPEQVAAAELFVAGGWAWIMGFGVVIIATFGPVIFARVETAGSGLPTQSETAQSSYSNSDSTAARSWLAPDDTRNPDGPGGVVRTVRRKPDGPGPGAATKRLSKAEAERFVVTEVALGRTIPSQATLAGLCNRPETTVSDWFRDWERRKLIPARTQRGRCKALTKAE